MKINILNATRDTVTIEFKDPAGIPKDFVISNGESIDGKDGVDGKNGRPGRDGADGKDGKDGKDGQDGRDGIDGKDGIQGKDGEKGPQGNDGPKGEKGADGSQGPQGERGPQGEKGKDGRDGKNGIDGRNGLDGKDGLSAYALWLLAGNEGTSEDFLKSLKGKKGKDGEDGKQGDRGARGPGGPAGENGLSAYEVALENGFVGNEAAWLASLQGEDGAQGPAGNDGADGSDGADGVDATNNWPTTDITNDYTLVIGDVGKKIVLDSAARKLITVPTNASVAFAIGDMIQVCQVGVGGATIEGDVGVTVLSDSGDNMTAKKYSSVWLHKVDTNEWHLWGELMADSGAAFDADYQAVLDRATFLTYTKPTTLQQAIQNQLVLDLKAAGIWNKLDCFYVFANDGSSNFATLNWKAPSANQCTLVNSPTFTPDQGFKGNASTSYVDTNFNIATHGVNYTQNNASRFAWVTTAYATNALVCGMSASLTHEALTNDTSNSKRINQGGLNQASDLSGAGLLHLSRVNSSTVNHFKDTTNKFSGTRTSAAMTSANILIGRGLGSVYGDPEIGLFGMGADLTTEATALHTCLSTYMGAI